MTSSISFFRNLYPTGFTMTRQFVRYFLLLVVPFLIIEMSITPPSTASTGFDQDHLLLQQQQDDHEGLPGGRVGG